MTIRALANGWRAHFVAISLPSVIGFWAEVRLATPVQLRGQRACNKLCRVRRSRTSGADKNGNNEKWQKPGLRRGIPFFRKVIDLQPIGLGRQMCNLLFWEFHFDGFFDRRITDSEFLVASLIRRIQGERLGLGRSIQVNADRNGRLVHLNQTEERIVLHLAGG